MELHAIERQLTKGIARIDIFDETGTLQGYVQGSLDKWNAHFFPTKYLDTFETQEEAVDTLVSELTK